MQKFAAHGDVYLRDINDRNKKVKQILWGDWLNVADSDGDWFKIKWGSDFFWLRQSDCVEERPLEVVFVDVGQGDGCLVVTPKSPPEEKIFLIDAGDGDNMYRFVRWRFGKYERDVHFHAAIVTHSDHDHYHGFQKFFDEPRLSFDTLYHNGIAERAGDDPLGPSDENGRYLNDIMVTDEVIRNLYSDPNVRGAKPYPKLINTALTNGRTGAVEMLHAQADTDLNKRYWMPGFGPDNDPEFTIEVLAPLVELDAKGNPMLRWFGDKIGSASHDVGKTKNGHSVLLQLSYRNFKLVFGGDLNRPAEDFLLRHYGEISEDQPLEAAVAKAGLRLRSDVLKSCHHGSSDVTDAFLQAVNPSAFVVSSGDEESYVHPRPDLLGRLGKFGRGDAPLILCTEILRSSREQEDTKLLVRLKKLNAVIEDPITTSEIREESRRARDGIQEQLARRNVEVYGAITLRTDGRRLALAFRMEQERAGRTPQRWQIYWFELTDQMGLVPVSGRNA